MMNKHIHGKEIKKKMKSYVYLTHTHTQTRTHACTYTHNYLISYYSFNWAFFSLWYQNRITLTILTIPPENMPFELHFLMQKVILIIIRVMSLTLIHIYPHIYIEACTLQQRKWFGCWPCECKKQSWSPMTHIYSFPLPASLLSSLPRLPLAFYATYQLK